MKSTREDAYSLAALPSQPFHKPFVVISTLFVLGFFLRAREDESV